MRMRLVRYERDSEEVSSMEQDLPDGTDAATESPIDEQPDDAVEPDADEVATPGDVATPGQQDAPTVDLGKLEALLFSTHHPLTAGRLAELLELDGTRPVRRAIADLNRSYQQTGRCFRIEQVAGGYQMLTLPEHGELLKRLHQRESDGKLGKAALETLAIIAYKQPILRAEVESIRGVACGETIRGLMEKHLVRIAGRAEEPGRPILYGTTKRFLEVFGLNSLKDLPQPEDAPSKIAANRLSALPDAPLEAPAQT